MKSPNPASLQNLNDIVLPAQVSWWPLATGWYFMITVALAVLAWYCYRKFRRWFANRYRRAALREFRLLEMNIQGVADRETSLRQIPVLIKRTALAAYPRGQVASLTGSSWHQFLNSKVKSPPFTQSVAGILDRVSYATGDLNGLDPQATTALLKATRHWLKHHQAAPNPSGGKGS
jgi:hypothetical protein